MKKLKKYIEYLKEDLIDDNPMHDLQSYVTGLKKRILKWFDDGEFTGSQIIDIDITNFSNALDKTLIFNFTDNKYNYQVTITVRPTDYQNDELSKMFVKIKKYSMDNENASDSLEGYLIDEWNGQCKVEDLSPEFILDNISKMEEEPQSFGSTSKNKSADIPVQLETPPAQGGAQMPPAQGGAQGGEMPPAQGGAQGGEAPAF